MIRRTEAATAVALFSTSDLLDVQAWNQQDPDQADAVAVAKPLLQARLESTKLRWFQTAIGAMQDTAVAGACISMQDWIYRTRPYKAFSESAGITEETDVLEDRPDVRLIPVENFRFDPGCDWRDPVGTSPYLIEKMPRYVCDVKADARRINKATGAEIYLPMDNRQWAMAVRKDYDSIRSERQGVSIDRYDANTGVDDYAIVIVYRHIMRVDETDWYFETLDNQVLLARPRPVEEIWPHLPYGERPYTLGVSMIEAHNPIPQSSTGIVAAIQEEGNELVNLSIDTTRMSLMSRWKVRRGANVDMPTLTAGIPGSAIVMDNIAQDAQELKTGDVGAAAFQREDRLNTDMDEASGNFSLASIANNKALNETVGGMNMLNSDASSVKEFELRVFAETWVEPVLNQLYALEAAYETDENLLRDVCTTTKLPLERVLQVLALRLRIRVNVGFNATSPEKRIGRLTMGLGAINQLFPQFMQTGANMAEIVKEIFGALGYKDGARFFPAQDAQNPEVEQLKQQVAQLQQMIQTQQIQAQSRIEVAKITAQNRMDIATMGEETKRSLAELSTRVDVGRLKLEQIDRMIAAEQVDTNRRELVLEREALSHQVQQDNARLLAELSGMNASTDEPIEGEAHEVKDTANGPAQTTGDDRAGIISRGQYGDIPFAQG